MNAGERKKAQRSIVRARLAKLTPEEKTAASAAIATRLRALPEWEACATVALFAPLSSEPDPGWPSAKRVALPRLLFDPPGIELREAAQSNHLITVRTPQGWDLREPGPNALLVAPDDIHLVLVPGIAFDRTGRRLGRGGGWYDRLLARLPASACRVGVFFGNQELAEVEAESHDHGLDLIVTEFETIRLCR
jgi:5-formyltetrahydrofolate cyclo-ligase